MEPKKKVLRSKSSRSKSCKKKASKTRCSSGSQASKTRRVKKAKSQTKITWEKFLKNQESVDALKKSWKSKNPEEYYKKTIKSLARKFSNKA